MDHVFIVNPESGSGKYTKVLEIVQEYFLDKDETFEIRFTEYIGHAIEIAQEYKKLNTVLYSVGGDGTSHEVLNGLQEGVSLAIIPVGSGNDFWRMINYQGTLKEIVIDTIEGKNVLIDVGEANDVKFLNCSNIGFDAKVNVGVNGFRLKWFPRKFIYAIFALKCLMKHETMDFEIDLEGETVSHSAFLASFMNGKWYGGGFLSAPNASIRDGLLDVCIVADLPRRKVPALIPVYFKGKHLNLDIVTYAQASSFRISAKHPIIIGLDGEVKVYDHVDIKVLPSSVSLRVPNRILID